MSRSIDKSINFIFNICIDMRRGASYIGQLSWNRMIYKIYTPRSNDARPYNSLLMASMGQDGGLKPSPKGILE